MSEDNFKLREDADEDDEVHAGRQRTVNPSNLANASEVGGDFGIEVKSTEEMDASAFFQKSEADSGEQFMAVKPWKGAIVAPTNAGTRNGSKPDEDLKIEWAYGYRGFDAHDNVVLNKAGHIVYTTAALGIVFDAKSHTQRHFTGHNDDIVCLAQNPANKDIVASGQVATIVGGRANLPHIAVWDTSDFKNQWILPSAHRRAVLTVGFSTDGQHLASVGDDDNFTLRVWDWKSRTMLAEEKTGNDKIYHVCWSNTAPNQFTTVGKDHIFFWTFEGGSLKKTKASLAGKYPWQSFLSVTYSANGFPCVGAKDGSIYIFVSGECKKVVKGLHASKVSSLNIHSGGIVTGGGDSAVLVLDGKLNPTKKITFPSRIKSVYIQGNDLVVGTYHSEIFLVQGYASAPDSFESKSAVVQGHFDGELWGVDVHPDGKSFVTAGEDNTVSIWDIKSHRRVDTAQINAKRGAELKVRKAATSSLHSPAQCARAVAFHPNGTEFAIGTNKGEVIVFKYPSLEKVLSRDLNGYSKRQVVNQTENWIQTLQYSPSGQSLAVGTHGIAIVILSTNGYRPVSTLKSHNAVLTHLDWSADSKFLQSNCAGYELLFHDIDEKDPNNNKQNPRPTQLKDVRWASQTCILGWPVQGVFDPTQDGTDVNSVDASNNRKILATGDDYGFVNLFRYPALDGAQKKTYEGHSSHVPCVRFTHNDAYLISTGGCDKTIIQWAVTA